MLVKNLDKVEEKSVTHNPELKKREMLVNGEVPHLAMFSQVCFKSGQKVSNHKHKDMHEIFFVESGSGVLRSKKNAVALFPGKCVAVKPEEDHEIEALGDLVLIYFGIIE